MFYIAPDTLPPIEDFLNLLADPSAKSKTASEDKSVDNMVNDFLRVDPSYVMTDWLTFDKAFECVSSNLNPNKGVENLLMIVAIVNEDDHCVESVFIDRVVDINYEFFTFETTDGSIYDNGDLPNHRFRLAVPKKDIRNLNPRDTVSEVTLKDGSVLKSGTIVKGGVLFINDAGDIDVYPFSDIKDFVV